MSIYRVLITDYVWPSLDPERRVLDAVGAELVVSPSCDEATLMSLARDADAILNCFSLVTAGVIAAAPRLRIIARYGIGVDSIDVSAATARGIPVTNVPSYCKDEVSDHALALLLACWRKLPLHDRAIRRGEWKVTTGMPMHRLRGRTLGIVGFGQIGRLLAEKSRGFGVSLLVSDPYASAEAVESAGGRLVALDDLLRNADLISLHVPLTPQTHNLIGAGQLRLMKSTAVLVNTARGGLIEISALVQALEEGWIAGAGLDVLPEEPPLSDTPLFGLDNVILTPHTAFYSEESLVDLQTKAAEEVARVLTGQRPLALVNPEVWP